MINISEWIDVVTGYWNDSTVERSGGWVDDDSMNE